MPSKDKFGLEQEFAQAQSKIRVDKVRLDAYIADLLVSVVSAKANLLTVFHF